MHFRKAVVIGYGSMGRRRIRLLKRLLPDISILTVDLQPARQEQSRQDGYPCYESLRDALSEGPDLAFVCTSPGRHADLILELLQSGVPTFTELNLTSDRYAEILQRAKEFDTKVFMSSTMLYDRQILAIEKAVRETYMQDGNTSASSGSCSRLPLTYLYHVGQYLPDWHPWERYQDFFIGRKETNGVREIYAIQLPWILKLFGRVSSVTPLSQHATELEIDFPDSFVTSFVHESGAQGVFVADVVSRSATTYLEIIGERLHLKWDGSPEGLTAYDPKQRKMVQLPSYAQTEHVEGYADNIIEDEYLDEIQSFLDYVKDDVHPVYTLEDDRYTLDVIDRIGI